MGVDTVARDPLMLKPMPTTAVDTDMVPDTDSDLTDMVDTVPDTDSAMLDTVPDTVSDTAMEVTDTAVDTDTDTESKHFPLQTNQRNHSIQNYAILITAKASEHNSKQK